MTRPLVMGIVNVTPDSFSGDGVLLDADYVSRAVQQALQMIEDGADMLDIGGESSRPGAVPVPADEEMRRVVPVIAAIREKLAALHAESAPAPEMPMAVDTVKAEVAEAALNAGASIINDISALAGDARMSEVAVRYNVPVVLMHNRAAPTKVSRDPKAGGSYEAPPYKDVVAEVAQQLQKRVEVARAAGIAQNKIILDPGIGFGKTIAQNLALIAQLGRIKALGFPVLVGPSRKSFIGRLLDATVDERVEGTAAAVAISVMQGADIVRVHDVRHMVRVVKVAAALRDAAH